MTAITKLSPPRLWRHATVSALSLALLPGLWSQDSSDEQTAFELSPFEVSEAGDQGYYSERTLAGSRIDTPLGDLAASISIINRQQLEDTASTDINDIMLYDLNTEGANTYSPTFQGARGGLRDFAAGFSHTDGSFNSEQSSNRIRGIAAPDASRNYYPSISQMGFDTYNTRNVEINRGPNSLLFGQGSPAGIVNQNTADAYTDDDRTEIQFRLGSWNAQRMHINHNQSIIDDVLGVYVAALYDEEGFRRKPAYDITRRVYGAVTYKPTEDLRIRGNYENYNSSNRRANTLTPRDAVTPWLDAGRPVYDPLTRMVTLQDTGDVYGPYTQSIYSPGYNENYQIGDDALRNQDNSRGVAGGANAGFIEGIDFVDATRPVTLIGSQDYYFTTQRRPAGIGTGNPNFQDPVPADVILDDDDNPISFPRTDAQHLIADRNYARSAFALAPEGVMNWNPPGVTNKDIYDWTKYNTNAMNYGEMEGSTANLEVDYRILDNWYIQAGWFKQDLESEDHYTVGQLEAVSLWVDPNVNLPNGEPNPFFGLPFVHDTQPDTFLRQIDNTNYRVQSAVDFDFTGREDIFRWLGRHTFTGVAQRQEWETSLIRTRAVYTGGHPAYLPWNDLSTTGTYTYWANSGRVQRQYYLGEPGGPQATVTRSGPRFGQPSFGGPTSNPVDYYNWNRGEWTVLNTEWGNALSEASTGRSERTTDSVVLTWNAYLLGDRLVPTIGYRHDNISNRGTVGVAGLEGRAPDPEVLNALDFTDRGYPILDLIMNNWGDEIVDFGNTWTYGATFDIFRTDQHEFTIFYNESENFNPPPSAQVNVFGENLPRPQGEGKDYGFSFSLWNNKLVARVNWFETTSTAERTGVASTAQSRLNRIDTDLMFPWAEVIARFEAGQREAFIDPDIDPFEAFPRTAEIQNRMEELTGLPVDYYDTLGAGIGATQTNEAEGVEIGITYNPTRNWTMRAAISSQETAYSVVAPEVDAWIEERMPVWESAASPLSAAENQFDFNESREADLSTFWGGYGYNGETSLDNQFGIVNTQSWYETNVLSQIALYKAQEGVAVPTQRKWRANFITRYNFTEGILDRSFVGGGVRWEDKAAIGYFGQASDPANPDTINVPDVNRPIYGDENWYFDFWAGHRMSIFDGRADLLLQLNVRNIFESGDLQAIGVNYDGTPHTFRIVDPRQFYLTATLNF